MMKASPSCSARKSSAFCCCAGRSTTVLGEVGRSNLLHGRACYELPMEPKSTPGRLAKLDLSLRLSRDEEQARLAVGQHRLLALRLQLGGKLGDGRLGPPVCVLLEGWDASGKGGAIKRLVASLDPRHVRVATFGVPTPDEKRHQYLWRFVPALPGWG